MNEIIRIAAVEDYASRICAVWRRSAEAIIETGRLLIEAKNELKHGEWLAMFDGRLPFTERNAQRLMEIGRDMRLANPTTLSLLPAEVSTIHAYVQLKDDAAFEAAVVEKKTGAEVRQQIKAEKRVERERDLGAKITALPQQKFGVIVADPPWRFEPYSRDTGMDRAADNHYPTQTLDEIARSHPVKELAADDCVLFLWATAPMLVEAIDLMHFRWGFTYKSHCVWTKDRIGTGYWFRNAHELLLVGTKGQIPAPAPGTQFPSVIEGRVTKHSAKPECFLEMIEKLFPSLPKIELNRRGPSRPGWDAWGNEAEPLSPTADGGEPPDNLDIPDSLRRSA